METKLFHGCNISSNFWINNAWLYSCLNTFGYGISIWAIGVMVVILNAVQWLISPYLVGAIYRVKAVSESENPRLHRMVTELSHKSGIKKPQVMLSQMPFPNAFAYGSPLTGSRVAVTRATTAKRRLKQSLKRVSHLKHRDVHNDGRFFPAGAILLHRLQSGVVRNAGEADQIATTGSRNSRHCIHGVLVSANALHAYLSRLRILCRSPQCSSSGKR